ncbi:helicase-related protein [Azotobacter sp. CWF10]
MIYGALSPVVRREQARRFREGEVEIMVATDAIGMGLNLPAHRLYFRTDEKFDGVTVRTLTGQEIKQIAGRAGRYGFPKAVWPEDSSTP